MSNKPISVTAENFEQEVINSDQPVLVDFWAEWCGPCKMIAPLLDDVAEKRNGELKIVKIDVDSQSEIAAQFRVRSIPTLMVFKGGHPAKMKVGAVTGGELERWLDSAD